ncbi:MAG: hypothetical protein IEMM0002_1351 [bacterium]|nr:MAG: hypothetical protein IEMM0002_1351 [bacterium]
MIKNRIAAVFFSVLFFASLAEPGEAGRHFPGRESILKGLRLSYNLRFDEAGDHFSRMVEEYPDSPAALFYNSAVEWGWTESRIRLRRLASLYGSTKPPRAESRNVKRILNNLQKTVKLCKELLKHDEKNFEALFYMAGAYAFTARIKWHESQIISAFINGKRAANIFDELLDKHPENGDAMLGPGIYKYFVGRLSAPMRWIAGLLGLSGTREEGLALMENAYRKGTLTPIEAADSMAWIYRLQENNLKKALHWANVLEKEIPGAPLADFHRLVIYHLMGDAVREDIAAIKLLEISKNLPSEELRADWQPLLLFVTGVIKEKQEGAASASSYKIFKRVLEMEIADPWLEDEVLKRVNRLPAWPEPAKKGGAESAAVP